MAEPDAKFRWHWLYLLAAYYMRARSIQAAMVEPHVRRAPAELGRLIDPYDDRSLVPNGRHIRDAGLLYYEAAAYTVVEIWRGEETGFAHEDAHVDGIIGRMDLDAWRRYRNSVFHPAHADDARRDLPPELYRDVHAVMDAIGDYIRANIPGE